MSLKYGWNHFETEFFVAEDDLLSQANTLNVGETARAQLKRITYPDMEAALIKISANKHFVYNSHAGMFCISRHR